MPLQGKVAQLPDQRTAVINIGSEDGVTMSDRYEIYELGDPVIDPDTGDEIGSIRYTKSTVTPHEIYEGMTVVRSVDVTTTSSLPINAITGETKRKKLSSDSSLENNRNEVKIGDPVIRVNEDEADTESNDVTEDDEEPTAD